MILLFRNGCGSNAGTAARDTENTSAARPMPRHRDITRRMVDEYPSAFFSGSRGYRVMENSGLMISRMISTRRTRT